MLVGLMSQTAAAQTVESLVMPGEVIAGHAEAEAECASCHQRFNRGAQDGLCLDCHEDIAADINAGNGFHGRADDVAGSHCAACHIDHEGRNADIVNLDEKNFDHHLTDYELLGKHAEVACGDCHAAGDKHRDAPQECNDCHDDDDVHKGFLGAACADCHNTADWLDVTFDHDTTDFPLLGHHRDAECLDCHRDETHQDTPTTCFGCHAEDDAHEGRSGEVCENCHRPTDWQDTRFDHARNTDFPLDGRHAELRCNDCHSDDPFDDVDTMDMACIACHREDDNHHGHYGPDCDTCHTTSAWDQRHFDHDQDTDYALHGAHETVACFDCHIEPIFEQKPGQQCIDCHRDDDAHETTLGDQCADCHNETAWPDAPRFDHDLTRFPLLGAHANVEECDGCHETKKFREAPDACIDCHRDDDVHKGVFEDDCESCHNPVAWDLWFFDHNVQTDFELAGAHVDVACHDCHRKPLQAMHKTGARCADCHLSDDVHDGEFGPDCGRCHSDRSFEDVRSLQ